MIAPNDSPILRSDLGMAWHLPHLAEKQEHFVIGEGISTVVLDGNSMKVESYQSIYWNSLVVTRFDFDILPTFSCVSRILVVSN